MRGEGDKKFVFCPPIGYKDYPGRERGGGGGGVEIGKSKELLNAPLDIKPYPCMVKVYTNISTNISKF